jgi:hypothetical protein
MPPPRRSALGRLDGECEFVVCMNGHFSARISMSITLTHPLSHSLARLSCVRADCGTGGQAHGQVRPGARKEEGPGRGAQARRWRRK